MGTIYAGAIMAGINPIYKPMELVHALNVTDAKVLVVMDALYKLGEVQRRLLQENDISKNIP